MFSFVSLFAFLFSSAKVIFRGDFFFSSDCLGVKLEKLTIMEFVLPFLDGIMLQLYVGVIHNSLFLAR